MRRIFFIIVIIALGCASAETIRLKNGRKILADSVTEKGGKIEYTIGEDTYAISKALVEGIDTGGSPIVTHNDPAPVVNVDLSGLTSDSELDSRLIKDGTLDTELLAEVDRQPPPERAAYAEFVAARYYHERGKAREAVDAIKKARGHLPANAELALSEGSLQGVVGNFKDAAQAAEDAVRLNPKMGQAHNLLGYCYYQLGRLKEAIAELKKGIELQPDEDSKSLLAKAERELAAESGFDEQSSNHFAMRYEGGRAMPALRQQILETLEKHFEDLSGDLDYQPRARIQVILYTNQQFFDVTQAPKWTGAVNDGKIRIPVSGLSAVNTNLSRVLKHELTHSFISLITNNRAPTWLNEGVAQLEEPSSVARDGARLSQLYNSGHNIPLNQLEGSFIRYSDAEATVAYAQSLASAEYIREVYGMSSVTLMLKRLGEGQSSESALRAAIHSGYAQFDREMAAWLKKMYE